MRLGRRRSSARLGWLPSWTLLVQLSAFLLNGRSSKYHISILTLAVLSHYTQACAVAIPARLSVGLHQEPKFGTTTLDVWLFRPVLEL